MLLLLIGLIIIGLTLVSWAVVKGNCAIRLATVFIALLAVSAISLGFGEAWGRMIYYDQYVYPFSRISQHLSELAKFQKINELTNDVVLLDSKFNLHKTPDDLQDAMLQILKLDKNSKDTNVFNSTSQR